MSHENPVLESSATPSTAGSAVPQKKNRGGGKILAVILLPAAGLLAYHFIKTSTGGGSDSTGAGPVVVAVAKAERLDLAQYSTLTAEFVPYQQVSVHAKVAGYVKSISVDIGDHVKAGEVMAVLEIPELTDDLNKATAAFATSQAEVGQAQADFDNTSLIYKRLAEVAKANPKLVAQQDIDNAKEKDSAAQSALDSAQRKVQENAAEVAKEKTLLAYCSIPAPFDGVITRRYADTGTLVQAGTASETQTSPVVDVAEDDVLRLIFPAPESVVPIIRNDLPVEISVKALNLTFPGKITRYAGKVDLATRSMRTEVDVPNPDGKLTPGMYADVKLPVATRKNVVAIPLQALSAGDQPTVLVLNSDGKLEERKVAAGLETATMVEVLSGVREGEMVVIGSRASLRAGQQATADLIQMTKPEARSPATASPVGISSFGLRHSP